MGETPLNIQGETKNAHKTVVARPVLHVYNGIPLIYMARYTLIQ